MPVSTATRVLNEMCSSRICVDSYDKGAIKGRIYVNYCGEPIQFESLLEMAKKMEEMFDCFEYPQQTIEIRSFSTEKKEKQNGQVVLAQPIPQDKRGEIATFHVKVIFRKHATWQGSVLWIDKAKEENFRSFLELCLLMDSALTL